MIYHTHKMPKVFDKIHELFANEPSAVRHQKRNILST